MYCCYVVQYILLLCISVYTAVISSIYTAVMYFIFRNLTFEVLTAVRTHIVVFVCTPHTDRVMNVLEERIGVCLHWPSDDGSNSPRINRLCLPFRLHGLITEKNRTANCNIIHFVYIVSL
jgi:hypothetical protein